MDVLTTEQRSRAMRANKSRGTKPELLLGRALWHAGIRYRKNVKNVAGKPDFVIRRYKVAIFCDGEFWHGRYWNTRKKVQANADYWANKIERNMLRDEEVNDTLRRQGWKVFRFWDTDIRRHLDDCLAQVLHYVSARNVRPYSDADLVGEFLHIAAEDGE